MESDSSIETQILQENKRLKTYIKQLEQKLQLHQSETGLREAQKLFSDVLDALPDMVWLKDPNGVYLMCNLELAKLVNLSREEIIGGTDYDIFPKEKADFYREHDLKAIENRATTINEESADYVYAGYSIWIETSKTPVYDCQGELIGVLGIGRDISTRKETLQESREKQAFLNLVVDRSPVPMLICSPNGTALRGNEAIYRMLHLTSEQIVGKFNLFKDDNFKRPGIAENIDLVLHNKQPVKFELLWKSDLVRNLAFPNDRDLYVDVSIFPLLNQDGDMTHLVVQWVDLTEHKQAESRLRESEEKFRKLYENSPFGIIINQITKDAQGKPIDFIHLQANPSTSVHLGMRLTDLVGTKATEIADEETAAKFIRLYGEVVRTRKPCNIEYYFSHHDRTLMVSAFHLTGDLFITNFIDITERKQAEEALRQSEELLANQNEELSSVVNGLQTAHEKLELALEAASAGTFSWDLQTQEIVWSDGHFRLHGYKPGEVEVTYEEFASRVHPGDLPVVQAEVEAARSNRCDYDNLYRVIWPDESVHWIQGRGRFVYAENGEAIRMYGVVSDADQWKRTEIALTEAQRIAKIGSWEWDIATGKISWSDAMFPVFGLEFQEPTYDLVKSLIHPEEVDWWENYLVEMLDKSKAAFNIDYRIIRPDGNIAWLHNEAEVLRNDRGEPISMFGTTQDVTERKQAEEALLYNQKRYQSLFNNSPVPLWEEDFSEVKQYVEALKERNVKDFREFFKSNPDKVRVCARLIKITDMNNAVLKLHEAESKEELLIGLDSIFTDSSYDAYKEELIAIAEGKSECEFEGTIKTLRGQKKEVILKWLVVPGHENTLEKVYVSTADITEKNTLKKPPAKPKRPY